MSVFVKPFVDVASATEAARRSLLLRHQTLPTPQAQAVGADVHFTRIEGMGGLSLEEAPPKLWLAPLAKLHACTLGGLPNHDPLKRIRPRLPLLTSPSIRTALGRLSVRHMAGGTLLHGDFHLGQILLNGAGEVWIIDLDDLCHGPPEADLGNLIANLATQSNLTSAFSDRLTHWRSAARAAWSDLSAPVEQDRVDHFIALALIRRHLKLREQARPDFEAEIADWVTRVACRTYPSDSAACPG